MELQIIADSVKKQALWSFEVAQSQFIRDMSKSHSTLNRKLK